MTKSVNQLKQQRLRVPKDAVLIDPAEQELSYGGARRPNSLAWQAGNLFIGTTLFGWGGVLFLL